MISEKFKQFVIFLHQNCIINKGDANILRKIYDKDSNIECKLIAYALNNKCCSYNIYCINIELGKKFLRILIQK